MSESNYLYNIYRLLYPSSPHPPQVISYLDQTSQDLTLYKICYHSDLLQIAISVQINKKIYSVQSNLHYKYFESVLFGNKQIILKSLFI